MNYGGIMRAMREKAGLSQEEIAHRLHINQSDVSKLENNYKVPCISLMSKWAQVTSSPEVVVAFLMGMDGLQIMQQLLPMLGFVIQISQMIGG